MAVRLGETDPLRTEAYFLFVCIREGEDMFIHIGDVSSHASLVTRVLKIDIEHAHEAATRQRVAGGGRLWLTHGRQLQVFGRSQSYGRFDPSWFEALKAELCQKFNCSDVVIK